MARTAATKPRPKSRAGTGSSRRSRSASSGSTARRSASSRLQKSPRRSSGSNGSNGTSLRTFRSALKYLRSLTNYEEMPRIPYNSRNYSLDRMKKLLGALRRPEKKMRTVHIAGTKGKGSTATMVACMLRKCGYKVGLYTSPHLITVRERLSINGELPSEQSFTKALAKVAAAAKKATTKTNPPTYFEILTATAFVWFAEEGVEVAVLEAGLGGRLDSTNVVSPDVCAITSISFDHMGQLGKTLTAIAEEKAGIIKRGVPVVSAPQRPEVVRVIREAAATMEAPLVFPGEDSQFSYRFESNREVGPHTRLSLTTTRSKFEHLHVPLPGQHQAINCSVALSMMDALKTRGFEIDDQKAIAGLADVRLSGRMEMVSEEPRVLVDGAHNAASIEALMRAIGQNVPYDSMIVIFACQKNKDIPGMLRHLQLGADKVIFTSTGTANSADPIDLLHAFQEKCSKMAQASESLDGALEIATSAITREDLICITGSFLIAGKAKRHFGKADPA